MAKADRYVDFLIEQFAPLGEITARAMMGGWVLYCDGFIFALVASGAVYLKGDEATIPRFEARGLRAFQPFPDKPMMTMKYYQAPPEIFEDGEAMRSWVGDAVAAGRRAKTAKRKRRKS